MESTKDMLTVVQASIALNASYISVLRWVKDGKLKGVKIGQRWYFTKEEIERILKEGLN